MIVRESVAARRVGAATERYFLELQNMPPSGGGGCHTALLRIANFGRLARLGPDQVAQDLRANIHGTRRVSDAEIRSAANKAFDSRFTITRHTKSPGAIQRRAVNGALLLDAILKRGAEFDEAQLWQESPVRISWPPERDGIEILHRLFAPDEKLFIGRKYENGVEHVLPTSEWILRFEQGASIPEHLIPNPLTGEQGLTKDRGPSFRADSCVARFRFAVVEFDAMPREQQIRFWAGVPLLVVALVDSGGKSIHGWIRVDAANADDWTRRVEDKLFNILTVVGADRSCKNEARLSRMPGHYRNEKAHWQRLLYLNPLGGPVIL